MPGDTVCSGLLAADSELCPGATWKGLGRNATGSGDFEREKRVEGWEGRDALAPSLPHLLHPSSSASALSERSSACNKDHALWLARDDYF